MVIANKHVDLTVLPSSRWLNLSKHILKQCWSNVGPASTTLAHHLTNIASMSRVCWAIDSTRGLPILNVSCSSEKRLFRLWVLRGDQSWDDRQLCRLSSFVSTMYNLTA